MRDVAQVVKRFPLGSQPLTGKDRRDEARQQRGVHLTVAIQLDDDVCTLRSASRYPVMTAPPTPRLAIVEQHAHTRIAALLPDQFARSFGHASSTFRIVLTSGPILGNQFEDVRG